MVASRSLLLAHAILLILATQSVAAAQGSGEIRGRVVNAASRTPIGIATVEVMDSAGGVRAHASTDADGSFRIEGLLPARYRVRILALGYTPRVLPGEISVASPSVDLGSVALTASALVLQPLQVTGQKRDVELAPDRTTYVVRDMPTTRGGTALDVLRNVPAVDVDIDNIVSLRGNTGVVLQINGRPSPLKPAQLGNFLAQVPADMVDKVEVIPNPSARENPEGDAGIINIVLKQKADEGRSGGLTVGGGTTGHVDAGGNLGYERGPLSLFGSYGFLRDNRPRRDTIFRVNDYQSPLTYLEEAGLRTQIPLAHTLTGSVGYQLGEHDALSADADYSTRNEAETYSLLYRDLDSGRTMSATSKRRSHTSTASPRRATSCPASCASCGRRKAAPTGSSPATWRSTGRRATRRHSSGRPVGSTPTRTRSGWITCGRSRAYCGWKRGTADRCNAFTRGWTRRCSTRRRPRGRPTPRASAISPTARSCTPRTGSSTRSAASSCSRVASASSAPRRSFICSRPAPPTQIRTTVSFQAASSPTTSMTRIR